MNIVAPRWPPRLARLYSEEVRKLEALHANQVSPGTTTWADAVEALFQKIHKVGPVKGPQLLQKAIDYLNNIGNDDRSHFMVATSCGRRTAILIFATFSAGPHPDPRVKEDGLTVVLHAIRCCRSRFARVTGIPVAYVSMHAVRRLFERGYDITENSRANSVFALIGGLGYLTLRSVEHANGGLSLLVSNILVVGSQHRCVKIYPNGREFEEAFFDVRTVLDANEIGPANQSLLEQGRIAAAVIAGWFEGEDDLPHSELAERIPPLPRREGIYPLRATAK